MAAVNVEKPTAPATMPAQSRSTNPFAGDLASPAFWSAIGALVLNDHVFKGSGLLPGWIAGKLSDFAGLFLAPILLFAILDGIIRLIGRRAPRRPLAAVSATAIAIGFILIKLVPTINAVVGRAWGPMALDPSDLLALPMCALAALVLTRSPAPRRAPSRILRLVALGAALLACAATSPMPTECHPSWRLLATGPTQIGCAQVSAWVGKSGKEGFGVTVALRSATIGSICRARVNGASFDAGTYHAAPPRLPDAVELTDHDTHVYLPFPFDNQRLWRESIDRVDLRRGLISLEIVAGDVAGRWDIVTTQEIFQRHQRIGERFGAHCDEPPSTPATVTPSASSARQSPAAGGFGGKGR